MSRVASAQALAGHGGWIGGHSSDAAPANATEGVGAVTRRATSIATASAPERATTETPNWSPPAVPDGTATAHMSIRLQKLVKVPSLELTPTGSTATSAIVGCSVVVGISSAAQSPSSVIAASMN